MKNYIILLFLLLSSVCRAVSMEEFCIQPINTQDGLPDKGVHCIYQDSQGYMWFGTSDGFCRYDGYTVKTFKSSTKTSDLIQNNMVLAIAEDSFKNLWIGTDMGLSIYNMQTGEITPVQNEDTWSRYIRTIYISRGQVWIGTENGLFLYDEATKEVQTFRHDPKDAESICGNKIRAISEDEEGYLWIGTFDNGLCRLNKETLQFTRYPYAGQNNRITTLYIDDNDVLWLGAWRDGVCRVDGREDPAETRYEFMGTSTLYERQTNCIVQDEAGRILLGTGLGLDIIAPPYGPADYHYSQDITLKNFPNYEIYCLYRDKNGIIWIATKKSGVFQLFKEESIFDNHVYETLDDLGQPASMNAFFEWEDDILIGVDKVGIARYNKTTRQIRSSQFDEDLKKIPFPMGDIRTIVKHPDKNELYLGSEYGGFFVCELDGRRIKSAFQYFSPWTSDWLAGDVIRTIHCDEDNNVWIGANGGFNILTPAGDKLIYSSRELGKHIICQSIIEDEKKHIWIASSHSGILKIDKSKGPASLSIEEFTLENGKISTNNAVCLYENSQKQLFAGTKGGGLCVYNEEKNCFEPVTGMESFANDAVLSIIESDGYLYMGTNRGLLQFAPAGRENEQLMVFTASDGLMDNTFNPNAVMKGTNGHLYFGTPRGFISFDPERIKTNRPASNIVISDIKIFHNSFDNLPEKQQKRISPDFHPEHSKRLILSHKEYNFGIEFATLSYKHPEKNRYAYMLKGFDRDWNYVSAGSRTAYYTNMKSGTYYFMVRGTNENSFMNPNPEILEIVVLPPPYKSWWAYCIYSVLFLFLCYAIIRILLYRSRVKIIDMEHRKNEELSQEKLKFFTNISHELLTPLAIISCSVEELQRKYNDHNNAWKAVKGNIFRLNRLLEQILEFRKAEKGKLKLHVSHGDAGAFIMELCQNNFKYYEQDKHIQFAYKSAPEHISAWFDKNTIDMVMYNLISNAFKYNKKAGRVLVTVEAEEEIDKYIYRYMNIKVGNTGAGFSSLQLKELFQRFQSYSYTGRDKQGNGIGLYLTKILVELHKGTIDVQSTPNEWTEFTIRIPIYKDAYCAEIEEDMKNKTKFIIEEEEADKEIKTTAVEKTAYTLLIIEDDKELLRSMTNLLSDSYTIISATDGESGLETAKDKNPDLIISDVMLPRMNGFDVCRAIKEDLSVSHIPIILLTAKVSTTDKVYGLSIGADAYITKPFHFDVLLAQIKSMLLNRQKLIDGFKKDGQVNLSKEGHTAPDQHFLEKAIGIVEKNMSDPEFLTTHFQEEMNMSNSMLYRKLKALTGLSPNEFIRNIRLKKASALLLEHQYNISEIAYMVGFNDAKYFTNCFKKKFGKTPSEYQNSEYQKQQQL